MNSRTVFLTTLIVASTLALLIYLTGLNSHRPLYLNALLSTTILSVLFLAFITTVLYRGWQLRDNYGRFRDHFHLWRKPATAGMDVSLADADTIDADSCGGTIAGLLLWVVIGLTGSLLFWAIGAVVWAAILLAAGLLYWIIFRAYRLIFRHSATCKGRLRKSAGIALLYTILYNCWIYAIIIGAHYLKR
jgi:hypothetical protein